MRIPAFILVLAGLAAAQNTTFELPSTRAVVRANSVPFGGTPIRYQQWYSAAEWVNAVSDPHRVLGVSFEAGLPGGQPAGFQVDMAMTIAHGPSAPSGFFDLNLVKDAMVVVPRQVVTLGAGIPGSFPLSFTFPTPFVWDGSSSVVLDIRVYSQNQAFDFDATETSPGKVRRMFAVNDPNAIVATFGPQDGWGLMTHFTARPGVTVPLPGGLGCPGALGFFPQATATVPFPPNQIGQTWDHTLTQAPSQRAALLVVGFSATLWEEVGAPLPLDLDIIGATGCFLLVEPSATAGAITIGGGPGSGTASLSFALPPVAEIIGLHAFSQWLINDPGAPNGVGAATSGLWHIVGPAGG